MSEDKTARTSWRVKNGVYCRTYHVLDEDGQILATVPNGDRRLAELIADIPRLYAALDGVYRSASGYCGDCGVGQEEPEFVEAARLLARYSGASYE